VPRQCIHCAIILVINVSRRAAGWGIWVWYGYGRYVQVYVCAGDLGRHTYSAFVLGFRPEYSTEPRTLNTLRAIQTQGLNWKLQRR